MGSPRYVGEELELFALAVRWKAYWSRQLEPFLAGDVLEVGAGIGNNVGVLAGDRVRRWVCLEPDPVLAARLRHALPSHGRDGRYEVVVGTMAALDPSQRFDAILYLDVLEHIEDDAGELRSATERLRSGGVLIVLGPAHQWLFSPFDAAVGHHRRYTRRSLARRVPGQLRCEKLLYLDSLGLLASVANRWCLKRSTPSPRQLRFWDTVLVGGSRWLDRVFRYSVGKSVLGVWRRTG